MNLNKIIDYAFRNLPNKVMHLSSEDIIKVPKYLFGYDIHQEYKKRRQEIKEDESIENKVLKIGLNYAQEGIRQSIRYMPLGVEVSFFYAHISDDPPLISTLHTLFGAEFLRLSEAFLRSTEIMGIAKKKFVQSSDRFTETINKIYDTFAGSVATLGDFENAYRRLNEIFDEDPKFRAFLRGRLLDNPYAALGLEKTATSEDIHKAYRKIALECHPDKNPNYCDEIKERFLKATQAYYQLTEQYKKL